MTGIEHSKQSGAGGMFLGLLLLSGAASAQTSASAPPSDELAEMRRITDSVQQSNYPPGSLARGEEGTVGVIVDTDKQGRIRSCEVSKSSGYPRLDRATCDLMIAHAKTTPFRDPNGGGKVTREEGRVIWTLPAERRAQLAKEDKAAVKVANNSELKRAGERKICRVQTKTGSLIATQRVCLSAGEWQRQYAAAQEETQDMRPKFQPGGP